MAFFRRVVAAFALIAALGSPAFASRNVAPCPSARWCHDVSVLKSAVYVYAPYGTFHLHGGSYAAAGVTAAFFDRPGLIAFDGSRAAVVTLLRVGGGPSTVYVHIFRRTRTGFYENVATRRLGAVRPMNVTLHGSRLRMSLLDPRGREETTVYRLSGFRLTAVATRHAQ